MAIGSWNPVEALLGGDAGKYRVKYKILTIFSFRQDVYEGSDWIWSAS